MRSIGRFLRITGMQSLVSLKMFKTNLMTHKSVMKSLKTPLLAYLKEPSNVDDLAIVVFVLSTCFVAFILGFLYGIFFG